MVQVAISMGGNALDIFVGLPKVLGEETNSCLNKFMVSKGTIL